MRPPESVVVGPHRYKIVVDSDAMARKVRTVGRDLLGFMDTATLTILVDPNQATDMLADTVLHEVLHTITALTGLMDEWGDKKDEAYISRLSPVLLTVVRANPDLIRFLSKEG